MDMYLAWPPIAEMISKTVVHKHRYIIQSDSRQYNSAVFGAHVAAILYGLTDSLILQN